MTDILASDTSIAIVHLAIMFLHHFVSSSMHSCNWDPFLYGFCM